jgi:hypothetical protein
LPIIPPTVARVEQFIEFCELEWDRSVGVLPIAHRDTLAWHVAVIAH